MCDIVKFKKILNNLMEEENIKNEKLAKITKINASTISRYKTGAEKPRLDNLIKLSSALKVSVSYLIGETDVKNADDTAIGLRFGIDDDVIHNLEEIKKINDNYDGEFNGMIGEIITEPKLYKTLAEYMNKTIKYYKSSSNKEKIDFDLGWHNGLEFDEYCEVKVLNAFFKNYENYIEKMKLEKKIYGTDEYTIKKQIKKYEKLVRELRKELKN